MNVLLRNTETKYYYAQGDYWVEDPHCALDFQEIRLAAQLAAEQKMAPVELVLHYDEPACELVLPLALPPRFSERPPKNPPSSMV